MKDAKSFYDKATDRASGLGTYSDESERIAKWSNVMPQKMLREGLKSLYSIDINDLNRSDPGAANEWSRVEDLLKTKFEGTPSSVNAQTQKKSLNDF